MAELVDALGSGPSGGNTVEVRVLFWAPESPCSCGSSQIWCTFGVLQKATYPHFTVTFTIVSRELYSADLSLHPVCFSIASLAAVITSGVAHLVC